MKTEEQYLRALMKINEGRRMKQRGRNVPGNQTILEAIHERDVAAKKLEDAKNAKLAEEKAGTEGAVGN